jgi:transcriptional regulator with XRE-family HTH domain
MNIKQLATNMRRRRRELDLTQCELASLAAVGQSEISKFETLRTLPYDCQADRLAQILGLKPEELQQSSVRDPKLSSPSEEMPAEVCA